MNKKDLKPLTLLYIEDEPLIRQNAVEYLSRYYATVLEAKDGQEGYEMYEQHSPDIIISDIKMPRLSGLEFATKVREQDKTTPIIIATAHTETEYLLKAVELQLIKYIIKPITSEKLSEALEMAHLLLEGSDTSLLYLDTHIYYDTLNKTLFNTDKLIKLTHNELLFFDYLVTHRQRAITYEEIESLIWAYEGMSMDALRSLVRGVRKKVGEGFVENISGIGYKLSYHC